MKRPSGGDEEAGQDAISTVKEPLWQDLQAAAGGLCSARQGWAQCRFQWTVGALPTKMAGSPPPPPCPNSCADKGEEASQSPIALTHSSIFPRPSARLSATMAGIISFGSGSANKSRPAVAVDSASTVTLDALPVRHVETDQERPGRSAKHLIKANHVNYAVVYKDLQQSNTNAHAICTAYILGANENQLNAIYDEQIKDLEPWRPSPAEVIDEDWRDFLGDRNYQRAFVDFFEDKLAMKFSYNWKEEMISVLTAGDEPLVNCLIGGCE